MFGLWCLWCCCCSGSCCCGGSGCCGCCGGSGCCGGGGSLFAAATWATRPLRLAPLKGGERKGISLKWAALPFCAPWPSGFIGQTTTLRVGTAWSYIANISGTKVLARNIKWTFITIHLYQNLILLLQP